MSMFRELFQRKSAMEKSQLGSRYFMRIISGPIDEQFQFKDAYTSVKAMDAYRNGEFFGFSTLKGKKCVVNFRQVQAVNFSEMSEITSTTQEAEYVSVYLANRGAFLVISADTPETGRFLDSLLSDDLIVSLKDWQFDRHEIVIAVAQCPT